MLLLTFPPNSSDGSAHYNQLRLNHKPHFCFAHAHPTLGTIPSAGHSQFHQAVNNKQPLAEAKPEDPADPAIKALGNNPYGISYLRHNELRESLNAFLYTMQPIQYMRFSRKSVCSLTYPVRRPRCGDKLPPSPTHTQEKKTR